jgi:hypothetical protein
VSDPHIEKYKFALKQLGIAIKSAHKTKEGKQLSSDYWVDIIKMLKKAKLGISMVELGIDDEAEISSTHDKTKDNQKSSSEEQPSVDGQKDSDSEEDASGQSNDAKLAAIGLKKESTNKFYDTLNHLGILLSEKFDNVSGDGTEFVVDINDRKFTIKFDDKFFMVSEDYNFELGDDSDVQSVVNTFAKLSSISHKNLVQEYNQELL